MSLCVMLFVHCLIALSLIKVWITECKNLRTMVLRNLVFSTLKCLYFLCFGHSNFISIDIDTPLTNYSYGYEIHQIGV